MEINLPFIPISTPSARSDLLKMDKVSEWEEESKIRSIGALVRKVYNNYWYLLTGSKVCMENIKLRPCCCDQVILSEVICITTEV